MPPAADCSIRYMLYFRLTPESIGKRQRAPALKIESDPTQPFAQGKRSNGANRSVWRDTSSLLLPLPATVLATSPGVGKSARLSKSPALLRTRRPRRPDCGTPLSPRSP